jgi:SRSO17 transposase
MDVHASPAALPEVPVLLNTFQVRCRRPEGGQALARYLTGLLTELPNKNGETTAQAIPAPSAQRWQECLTNLPWDEEDLNRQRVQKLMAEGTLGDGVVVVADPGVAKQGKGSVGVARQYAGTLGQGGNCPVAVTCCATDPQATWPVAGRWYLPEAWAEDAERRQQARVPAEVTCHTKPELALSRLEQARGWGVPYRCVVADADDGDHPNCLAGWEGRQER